MVLATSLRGVRLCVFGLVTARRGHRLYVNVNSHKKNHATVGLSLAEDSCNTRWISIKDGMAAERATGPRQNRSKRQNTKWQRLQTTLPLASSLQPTTTLTPTGCSLSHRSLSTWRPRGGSGLLSSLFECRSHERLPSPFTVDRGARPIFASGFRRWQWRDVVSRSRV